jgi:hypothetical protein
MIHDYDKTNSKHEENLIQFYKLVFGNEPDLTKVTNDGRTMVEDIWKDIGF